MPEWTEYVCMARFITVDEYIDMLEQGQQKNREDIEYIAIMSDIELEG